MTMFFILIINFMFGLSGSFLIYRFGHVIGVLDVPVDRSSHVHVTPKGGGIGIFATFVFCSVYLGLNKSFWIPSAIISLVSFAGDRIELKAKVRLLIQFICGMVFLSGFYIQSQIPAPYFLLIIPLSIFIIGTSNFYNFMDGINGIAGITGVTGFMLLFIFGHMNGADTAYLTLSLSIALSCLGFLPFNVPKAKVFMGDIGSILLGFIFGCMVVMSSGSFSDFIVQCGFLFPFYADELSTMAIRIRQKDSLLLPHRKHLYQILANELKIPHWKISLSYGLSQLMIGLGIIHLRRFGIMAVLFALALFFFIFLLQSFIIRRKALSR